MIGVPFVLSETKSPLTAQNEAALILAHAYRLAYEDYLHDSKRGKISRFLHLAKPKQVSVIARVAYRLKIVPFSKTEVLISDSASACTEKVDVVSMDSQLLVDSTGELMASTETNEDQTRFLTKLRTVDSITQQFHKANYQSPFVPSSNPLGKETVDQLSIAQSINENRIVESEFAIADRPEQIRNALLDFLENFGAYSDGMSKAKDRTIERSQLIISLLKERYPIKAEVFSTTIIFEWKPPEPPKINNLDFSKPVVKLIDALKAETRPEIEAIERQSATERGKIERKSNLERRELERIHDTQIRNAERDANLEIRRLESDKENYERQVDILESQYNETSTALSNAEEEYEELTEDSTITAHRLADKIARLENERDGFADKKASVERILGNLESELDITKQTQSKNSENLRNAKNLALENHSAKLAIQIDAIEELRRRSTTDKLAHVTEIEREKVVIEKLIEKSTPELTGIDDKIEKFELPNFWSDDALLKKKIDVIKQLEKAVVSRIDQTSRTMDETQDFLRNHLIRLNGVAPSVTVDIVMPFWYIEINSTKHDQTVVEAFIVPPSEVVYSQVEPKKKPILGITLIPTMPAVAAAIELVKKHEKARVCAHLNNQIKEMNPSKLFGRDSKIVRDNLISKDLHEAIQSDFKKRFAEITN